MPRRSANRRSPRSNRMLMALVALLVAVIVGGVMIELFSGHHTPPSPSAASTTGTPIESASPGLTDQQKEDAIAAAQMLTVPVGSNKPSVEVGATTSPMTIPAPSSRKVSGIPVYPHTPEGAVAQLAALDTAAAKDLNVDRGRAIHDAWAMVGAVPVNIWAPTYSSMQYWQQYPGQSPQNVTASVTPVQGLIKGSVGSDWVLACYAGRFQGTYSGNLGGSVQQGVADCARMQWSDDRWMLGAGAAPAMPPLVWPRTELAYQAGFRDLIGGQ